MAHQSKPHVVLAGGSGFLGRSLAHELAKHGYRSTILTRGSDAQGEMVRYVRWDAKSVGSWISALDGASAIVNLVGRTVDCRKTQKNKKDILESRIDSVRALALGWAAVKNPPMIWLQSGTAHIFGDTGDEILDDDSPIGTGFAPEVGVAWERALNEANLPGARKVILRISFVIGRDGGALATLSRLARCFLGGTVGNGRQYISWIHQHDVNRLFIRALTNERMAGTFVATAPNPVTNREFMAELRSSVHRPWSPPTPGFMVRLAAPLLGTDPELARVKAQNRREAIERRRLRVSIPAGPTCAGGSVHVRNATHQ